MHNNHDLFVDDYCVDTSVTSYIHTISRSQLCGLCGSVTRHKSGETIPHLIHFCYPQKIHKRSYTVHTYTCVSLMAGIQRGVMAFEF